jgi:hypothetical protein
MKPLTYQWGNAEGVLKPETLVMLENKLTRDGCNLVDGWAATEPKLVKEWEKNGTLLEEAQKAQSQGQDAMAGAMQAHGGKMPPLSTAEINEIYGGPSHRR